MSRLNRRGCIEEKRPLPNLGIKRRPVVLLQQVSFQRAGRVEGVGFTVGGFVRLTGLFLPHLAVVMPAAGGFHFGRDLAPVVRPHRLVEVHPARTVSSQR
ncbi:hypothetical protein D3C73_1052600 [compost metagenome]